MLIHQNSLWHLDAEYWVYEFRQGNNIANIHFSAEPGVIPKTGDMIINNRHVPQEAGRE